MAGKPHSSASDYLESVSEDSSSNQELDYFG